MINWWPPPRPYLLRPTTSSKPNQSSTRRPDERLWLDCQKRTRLTTRQLTTSRPHCLAISTAELRACSTASGSARATGSWLSGAGMTPLQPADRGNFRNDFRCLIDPMRTILPEPLFGEAIENSSAYCSRTGLQLIAGRVIPYIKII